MSEERIVNYTRKNLPEGDATDWERLRSMTEAEIDEAARSDPDNPPLDEEFFERAKRLSPRRKKDIHLYVDEDVVVHFKKRGRGYQTRMNAVLRAFMEHELASVEAAAPSTEPR